MKKVIRKLFVNFEKEEAWINEMAAKGLNFKHYSFSRYVFEEGTPGEYIYRLELLKDLPSHPESQAYIRFMEDMGVEHVDSYMRWVYFRKKASEGPFDVYSDYDLRIRHYKRVVWLVGVVWFANLSCALANLILGLFIGHEKGLYFNAYLSTVNWSIVILFIPMLASYLRKIKKLKEEKNLYQ